MKSKKYRGVFFKNTPRYFENPPGIEKYRGGIFKNTPRYFSISQKYRVGFLIFQKYRVVFLKLPPDIFKNPSGIFENYIFCW